MQECSTKLHGRRVACGTLSLVDVVVAVVNDHTWPGVSRREYTSWCTFEVLEVVDR